MYGSQFFQFISGRWDVIGYMSTELVALPPSTVNSGILPKGTFLMPVSPTNDSQAVLASGYSAGFTTQDISVSGQTSLQAYKDRMIGKTDLPVTQGKPVTLRRPNPGAIIEFRGTGVVGPGNFVCTTGTGSLSTASARFTKLSMLQGTLRVAQTGDVVQYLLLDAQTVTINGGSYLQVRVQRYDGGIA